MTEPPRRYDVTITVDQDGGHHPSPAELAVAAQQAASASIVSAHTAGQIVSVVTVLGLARRWMASMRFLRHTGSKRLSVWTTLRLVG